MAEQSPMWRQGFDALEASVAPRLDAIVRSEQFVVAFGLLTTAQRAVQKRMERSMRRALHLVNLPAGSDVTRILAELGTLQREVRELATQVGAARGVADDTVGRGSGPDRAGTARR